MKVEGIKCDKVATYEVKKGNKLVLVLCDEHAEISIKELLELKMRSKLVPNKLKIKKI
jgi:hypothetical protein